MVAIVILLSGVVGLAAATLAVVLEAGLIAALLIYAVVGNLTFAVLSGLAIRRRPPVRQPDFAAEIEADLQALLEDQIEALPHFGAGAGKKRNARPGPMPGLMVVSPQRSVRHPGVFRTR